MKKLAIITENKNYTEKDKKNLLDFLSKSWFDSINSIKIGPFKNELSDFILTLFNNKEDQDEMFTASSNRATYLNVKNKNRLINITAYNELRTAPLKIKNNLNILIHTSDVFVILKSNKKVNNRNNVYVLKKLKKLKDRDYFIIEKNGEITTKNGKISF